MGSLGRYACSVKLYLAFFSVVASCPNLSTLVFDNGAKVVRIFKKSVENPFI